MSSKNGRDARKSVKNQPVTSRCVAVIFKRSVNFISVENADEEGSGVGSGPSVRPPNDRGQYEMDKQFFSLGSCGENKVNNANDSANFDAKKVFEEFKLRNKTCYWNPALVDSVNSLEYVGFIEPLTVLVKGDDIHLENIRTAWGRRVLKDPTNFYIDRIGDVNGIEMQVIPQTQFIPLPEALCLIIMDLNNSQIVATLDTVYERLKHCYQGIHLPGNQLVYDTLGQLIRERKVFHTGCGYFVVTPDTFRMHGDDIQNTQLLSPWTHLHPMYIPAAFSQQPKQPMRSISCQVDVEDNMIGQSESCDVQKRMSICNEKLQVELPSAQRVQRSMSLSVRQSRDRKRKDEVIENGSLKRSSSVKGRAEKMKSQTKDEKQDKKETKSKEKGSFLSKLFGRNKKKEKESVTMETDKTKTGSTTKPVVEYATFSAQFPPPEWLWYQQQLDRQLRTESWVQQQVAKAGTWHYLNKLSSESPSSSIHPNSLPERPTTMPATKPSEHFETKFGLGASRKVNKKTHKHKDRLPVVIANTPTESTRIEVDQKHTYRNSMGQTNIKLSSLPTGMSSSPSGEIIHSNYVTHPMFSSTPGPRFSTIHERLRPNMDQEQSQQADNEDKDKSAKTDKSKSHRKSHRSKRKSHHDRHSSYHPSSRHVSGMSTNLAVPPDNVDNDISYEYQGQLPNKNSAAGMSHSSGVNCIGLDTPSQGQNKGQRYQRSNSYRHSSADEINHKQRSHSYRHVVMDKHTTIERSETSCQGHIYANVHASEQEVRPKLPERTHRRRQSGQNPSPSCAAAERPHSPETPSRYSLDLPESDRRSEHGSDRGTLTSTSSQCQSSQDSAIEGTESSEHSLGTVINTKPTIHRLVADIQHMSLGDSGFSSPRVLENMSDKKNGESTMPVSREQNSFLCNNLKNVRINNSSGKLDECSDDSFDRISSDRLYENVRISQKEVLNNMKYLHKEINVSSQNLNVPNVSQENSGSTLEFDSKQSVVKKFNFEGDFHVVGVV